MKEEKTAEGTCDNWKENKRKKTTIIMARRSRKEEEAEIETRLGGVNGFKGHWSVERTLKYKDVASLSYRSKLVPKARGNSKIRGNDG
jgi:hypothetical protein